MTDRVVLAALESERPPLIGMVHLLPLPGSPGWSGSLDAVIDRAVRDAERLNEAGFAAVMVENFGDVPFFSDEVPAETVAALTRLVTEVRTATTLPVGVNVLRNDGRAALGIAAATGARFVRVNVHTGAMWTDQGLVTGQAAETLRLRSAIAPGVAILADVHVKHAVPPVGSTVEQSASDAWHRGLADALIATGPATGAATGREDVAAIRRAVPDAPIIAGSGVTGATVADTLAVADAVIVGTSIMHDGKPGSGIDADRARSFAQAAAKGSR
jgi:membrane complex biogenesis BtpA family protein